MLNQNIKKKSGSAHHNKKKRLRPGQKSLAINTSRIPTSPSRKSPSTNKHSVRRSETSASHEFNTSKTPISQRPISQVEYIFPKHIEVIDRLRKIKNFSQVMPFSPEIPPAVMRNW